MINPSAFEYCYRLKEITIPENVTSIQKLAFKDCHSLTSVVIPDSVTVVGESAFHNNKSIKVELSNTITFFGTNAFGESPQIIYRSDDMRYLLTSLWTRFKNVRNKNGGNISRPTLRQVIYHPNVLTLFVDGSNVFNYEAWIENESESQKGRDFTFNGLEPNSAYEAHLKVILDHTWESFVQYDLHTYPLTLTTLQPKVITEGNVIVAAESNLEGDDETVGFEWRRIDWTDDFASNQGMAILYEGTMEGYLRNVNAKYLWKVRPYYESAAGNRYYGDWVGLDPSNTSYFEPTVHTYAKVEVNGNTVLVKGYAQRGTDNITSQGFVYWKSASGVKGEAHYAPSIPADAQTVEAKGTVMEAELTGLEYMTQYHYVAFVTTSEGETFYGEEKSFTTDDNTTGLLPIVESQSAADGTSVIYDLNGRRLAKMQRGLNIVRYPDGSAKKILIK